MQLWTEVSVSLRTCMEKCVVTLATNTMISRKVQRHFTCDNALCCFTLNFVPEALVPSFGTMTAADWGNSKILFRHSWKLFHPAADWA